jgi:hypothetical protein
MRQTLSVKIPAYKKGILGYGQDNLAYSVFVTLAQAVGTWSKSYPELHLQEIAFNVAQRAIRSPNIGNNSGMFLYLMEQFMGESDPALADYFDTINTLLNQLSSNPDTTHSRLLRISELGREEINHKAPALFAPIFGKNVDQLMDVELIAIMCSCVTVKIVASDRQHSRLKDQEWAVYLACAMSTEFLHLASEVYQSESDEFGNFTRL